MSTTNMLLKHRTQSFQHNPFYLNYKELGMGEFFDFRVLSLDEDSTVVIPCRKVTILNPRTKEPMNIPIHDPGYEASSTLRDHSGKLLSECPTTNFYRVPVWVTAKGDAQGNTEPVSGALRYLEFGEGIKNSFFELEDEQNGMFAFLNNESGVPEYEVRLIVIPGPSAAIKKNYRIEGVFFDPATKKQVASFGQPNEVALKNVLGQIDEGWEALMEAMNITEGTYEEASKRLRPSGDSNRPAMSNRPVLGGDVAEAEESQAPQASSAPTRGKYAFGNKG